MKFLKYILVVFGLNLILVACVVTSSEQQTYIQELNNLKATATARSIDLIILQREASSQIQVIDQARQIIEGDVEKELASHHAKAMAEIHNIIIASSGLLLISLYLCKSILFIGRREKHKIQKQIIDYKASNDNLKNEINSLEDQIRQRN